MSEFIAFDRAFASFSLNRVETHTGFLAHLCNNSY
jgi:hypothetical protein